MSECPEPRENPQLIGHPPILAHVLAQYARGNMHHAYLFTGAKGTGKATLAYHLARSLLAKGQVHAQEAEMDLGPSLFGEALPAPAPKPVVAEDIHNPESALFRRVAAGSHTDLLTITPAYDARKGQEKAEIGIDVVRKLGEFLSLTPAESDWRVVIIDAVDQLTVQAANAILKLLEEPPERSILLLICHNPASILPTIRSRCQSVVVPPPNAEDFAAILSNVAPDINRSDYNRLYALSYASPGQAITLNEHKGLQLYRDLFSALAAHDGKLPASLEGAAGSKNSAVWQCFTHVLEAAAQRLLVGATGAVEIFAGEAKQLAECRKTLDFEGWGAWQRAALELVRDTNIYHLDKKHSLRLICDPARLLALKAA